jgi:hypothetical protein
MVYYWRQTLADGGVGMHRRPLIAVVVPVSLYTYFMVRELGHLMAASVLKLSTRLVLRYRVLPAWVSDPGVTRIPEHRQALFIIWGPALALTAGYVLLALISPRNRVLGPVKGLLPAILCYAMLIFDPLYYTVIPVAGLGGEPAAVARLFGIPVLGIIIPAGALLIINVILVRRVLAPLLRRF